MQISTIPIPEKMKNLLEDRGYKELYPPQEEAVRAGVLEGKSLLVSTPTASGKTLIAVLAAGNCVFNGRGKVVYLTPLRALAREKYEEFKFFENLEKEGGKRARVAISTRDYDSRGESLGQADVLVLTNERFDSLVRHGASWLDDVKVFVADEVHLIDDTDRGPTLETALTRVLFTEGNPQLIALSATITNSKELATWLGADLVDVRWRPVPLIEGVYSYGEIKFFDGSVKKVEVTNRGPAIDLAVDTLKEGGQALIFAETRRRAVSLALKASEVLGLLISREESMMAQQVAQEIGKRGEETELSRNLAKAMANGVAFHHAGLAPSHRTLVEETFKNGTIKVLTATPTLAAGVNLPARRVIVSSLMRYDSEYGGQAPISVLDYKQMCGRAGRPQYDDHGETVIIAQGFEDESEIFDQYVMGKPEPLRSQLGREGALSSQVLGTVVISPGISEEDLQAFFKRTFFATEYRPVTVLSSLRRAVDYLVDEALMERRGKRFLATEFGKKVSTLYIEPATGVIFRGAIAQARKGLSHEVGILHSIVSTPDFTPKFPIRSKDRQPAYEFLKEHMDEMITKSVSSSLYANSGYDQEVDEEVMAHLRSVMVLYAWINEWNEDVTLQRLGVEPGDLYRAVDSAQWLLYSLSQLSSLEQRTDLVLEAKNLSERVRSGIKEELMSLASLEGVGRVRARAIYSSGYRNIEELRRASVKDLSSIQKIGTVLAHRIKEQLRS